MRTLILILILLVNLVNAQVSTHVMNKTARSAALAASELAHSNGANGLFTNPATLVDTENRAMLVGYQRIFNQSWMPYTVLGVTSPLGDRWGSAGLSIETSGVTYQDTTLSNELSVGVSHAFYLMRDRLSGLALGYTLKYYSLDYGRSAGVSGTGADGIALGAGIAFGVDFSLRANLTEKYWGAVVVKNINQPTMGVNSSTVMLPQEIQAGFAYNPYRKVWTNFSLVRTLGHATQFHAGLDYGISDLLNILVGIQSNPNRIGLGFNLNAKGFQLEYGVLTHPVLPTTQLFTLQVLL